MLLYPSFFFNQGRQWVLPSIMVNVSCSSTKGEHLTVVQVIYGFCYKTFARPLLLFILAISSPDHRRDGYIRRFTSVVDYYSWHISLTLVLPSI